jgi:hypothetical protein
MPARVLVSALAILLSCAISCRSVPIQSASRPDPSPVVEQFLESFNDLDLDQLRPLLAEDATAFLPFTNQRSRIAGRDSILAALAPMFNAERERLSKKPPYLNLTAKDVLTQPIGDTGAVITFDVGNEHVSSRRTLVVELHSGRWVIRHLHASNVRPE